MLDKSQCLTFYSTKIGIALVVFMPILGLLSDGVINLMILADPDAAMSYWPPAITAFMLSLFAFLFPYILSQKIQITPESILKRSMGRTISEIRIADVIQWGGYVIPGYRFVYISTFPIDIDSFEWSTLSQKKYKNKIVNASATKEILDWLNQNLHSKLDWA